MAAPVQGSPDVVVGYNVLRHPTKVLVKTIEEMPDESMDKKPGGQIPRGSKISTEHRTLYDYVQGAYSGGVQQYILPANVELGTDISISPKEFVVDGGVDRTGNTLTYIDSPATLTFDHDPSRYAKVTVAGPDELVDIFVKSFPAAFASAAWGAYDSSSSFIYSLDGTQRSGRRGFHVVFAVEAAVEIRALGARLFKRLWLLGYGYVHVSRDGKALPRTIFDTKVIEPQQPLFSGGAHCKNCEQIRPPPVWHDGGYVCMAEIPALTEAEEREYQRLIETEKLAAKSECDRRRREYMQVEADKLIAAQHVSIAQARRIIESRMGGVLIGSDVLTFDEHGEVTVAQVLADPARYDESTMADPIDGDEAGKAILYINSATGAPVIYSHAHGGSLFFLKHNIESLLARLAAMNDVQATDEWLNLLLIAAIRSDERERYLQAVKIKTGIGMGGLRAAVREQERQTAAADSQDLTEDPGLYIANQLLDQRYDGGLNLILLEGGYYYQYTGTHWAQIKDTVIEGQLQEIVQAQWERILAMWAVFQKKPSSLASVVRSALSCLSGKVVVAGDPLRLNSTHPSVINCTNGELWLTEESAELRKHRPDSFLTSCSPIAYDPPATTPTFEIAMRGILSFPGGEPMPDQDDMLRHVEELLGYTIQTRRNLKIFVMIIGPGDNGKTKVVKLLPLILGNDAIAFDRLAGVNENGNRFATSRLVGKLAIVDDDVSFEYLLPDELIKKIAEEKPLTAEAKFKDSITFTAQVVPWLLGNSWPRSRDLTRGMQTRANVMHWPRSFLKSSECGEDHPDRQRPELWDRIYADEMAGVLNRLIAGYYRVVERGGFLPPPSAQRAFDMWLTEANVVSRFIEEACEKIDPAIPGFTTEEIYCIFTNWCEDNGVQPRFRPERNKFKGRVQDLGYRVEHTAHGTGYYGLRLKANKGSKRIDEQDVVKKAKITLAIV